MSTKSNYVHNCTRNTCYDMYVVTSGAILNLKYYINVSIVDSYLYVRLLVYMAEVDSLEGIVGSVCSQFGQSYDHFVLKTGASSNMHRLFGAYVFHVIN